MIGIIAAILFPVIGLAKKNAKEKTCLSDLRQMAVAFSLYRTDHDDKGFLYTTGHGIPERYPYNNYATMSSYLKSGDILWCPEPGRDPIILYNFHAYPVWVDGPVHDQVIPTLYRPWSPQPGTVIAYCSNHTSNTLDPRYVTIGHLYVGKYLFAREDTSAGVAQNGQMEQWWCSGDACTDRPIPGTINHLRFPGEPWPPIPER